MIAMIASKKFQYCSTLQVCVSSRQTVHLDLCTSFLETTKMVYNEPMCLWNSVILPMTLFWLFKLCNMDGTCIESVGGSDAHFMLEHSAC